MRCHVDITLEFISYTRSSQGLTIAIHKEGFVGEAGVTVQKGFEEISRLRPERTETFLLALPDIAHVSRGIEADSAGTEVQGLLDTSARVVQQRQQRVIPLAFQAGMVGLRQDSSDFVNVEITHVSAGTPFGGNAQDGRTLRYRSWLAVCDKGEETAQRRQPTIAGGNGHLTVLLKICEKS